MKKILVFLFCGIVSGATFAQTAKSKWYGQFQAGVNNAGTENLNIGTFKNNVGFSGSLEGGYEINPYFGVGLNLGYNRLHYIFNNAIRPEGFNAVEASINFNLNLSQTLLGYLDNRKNNIRVYVGIGGAFSADLHDNAYLTGHGTPNDNAFGVRGGLQYERNIGKGFSLMADAGINTYTNKLDGQNLDVKGKKGGPDSHVNLTLGVRKYFGLGASRRHRADFKETIINRIEKRDTTVIKEKVEKRHPKDVYSIFFDIDKIDIRPAEVAKIQAVADFMKQNPEKVVFVFGYADKNTGTTKRNKWLAENRARVIIEQLVNNYGIEQSRILSYQQEGDQVQPFSEEEFEKNRSTICVITDFVR